MSNQRPGKTHKAAASDNGTADMYLIKSIRALNTALIDHDMEWVFQAMESEIRAGRKWPADPKQWEKVLGL